MWVVGVGVGVGLNIEEAEAFVLELTHLPTYLSTYTMMDAG